MSRIAERNLLFQLQQHVERFVIGEPIKSLFSPSHEIYRNFQRDEILHQIQMRAPDSLGGPGFTDVNLRRQIPRGFTFGELNSAQFNRWIREGFVILLTHELDESICVGGTWPYYPHATRIEREKP